MNPESRTMSDTPETDKLNGRLDYSLTDAYLLMTQHARKLERERDALKKHISIMDASHKIANDEYLKLAVENENLERERDAYKDTLRSIYDIASDSELIWFDSIRISTIANNVLNHYE